MADVAVCIPTYNQAAHLGAAVESALAQTRPCEVWISDDASTDATPAVVARLGAACGAVHGARHERNLGISGNANWVLRQPPAEYRVRLDSDDELLPAYVTRLAAALDAHPEAGYAHARAEEIGHDGRFRRLRLLNRPTGFVSGEESLAALVTGYRVAANICLFRASALEQVGYYGPLRFAEDWDLAARLADAGWGNVYVDETLARYRVWDAHKGIKPARKLDEIRGVTHVLGTTMTAAFRRRGWDEAPLLASRKAHAVGFAVEIRSAPFVKEHRHELIAALQALGDGPELAARLRLLESPVGGLVTVSGHGRRWLADQAKRTLSVLRGITG